MKIENIGQSMPAILKINKRIEGKYYISMKEYDDNQDVVIESLKKAQENGMTLPFIAPNDKDKIFSLPDFRELSFILDNEEASEVFGKIHS